MPRFPRYFPPFQYYNHFNYRPSHHQYEHISPQVQISDSLETSKNSCNNADNDIPVWLDIFGIKLYFDDVLILSLLFFLYEEQVKDEFLFLILLLLLIT